MDFALGLWLQSFMVSSLFDKGQGLYATISSGSLTICGL